jgi:hypothetical protein
MNLRVLKRNLKIFHPYHSMPQGKGTMHYKDGTYLEGKWVDGNLKEEKTT